MRMHGFASLSIFLLGVAAAGAATRGSTMRIKILDSETQTQILDNSGVPINCDLANYDAYCHNARTTEVTHTILAQAGDTAPFRIACTVDTRWSHCEPLPVGESFEAKREKHGLVVYFLDEAGKPRKQLYALIEAPNASQSAAGQPAPETAPQAAASAPASPPRGAIDAKAEAALRQAEKASQSTAPETVRCSFTSSPRGADIVVDGNYAGSTPSALPLAAGNHNVVVSMPGYARWERKLTVSAGAELTVNAVLEKSN